MDCIKFNFNENITDDSVGTLDELTVRVKEMSNMAEKSNYMKIQHRATENITLRASKDGYITNVNGDNLGKSVSISPNVLQEIYFSNGDYNLLVPYKNITYIECVSAAQKNWGFDLSVFNGSDKMTLLSAGRCNIVGDISNLNSCVNLQILNLSYTKATGSVEDLVSNIYQHGRRNGTLVIVGNNRITFKGQAFSATHNINVTFNEGGYVIVKNGSSGEELDRLEVTA